MIDPTEVLISNFGQALQQINTYVAAGLVAVANVVHEFVFLDAVSCPFGVELKLVRALLLGLGDRDEIRTCPSAFVDLVRDALVGKTKMPGRLDERRVDNWILDDDLAQPTLLPPPPVSTQTVSLASRFVEGGSI
jgi:hypothetical protein